MDSYKNNGKAWSTSKAPSSINTPQSPPSSSDKPKPKQLPNKLNLEPWESSKSGAPTVPAAVLIPATTPTPSKKAAENLGLYSTLKAPINGSHHSPAPSPSSAKDSAAASKRATTALTFSVNPYYTPGAAFTPKHAVSQENGDKDIEKNILAKPALVKVWNQKKWKALGLAGRSEMKKDIMVVTFKLPTDIITRSYSLDLNAQEVKTKMMEAAGGDFVGKADQYELRIAVLNSTIITETLPIRRQTFLQACNVSYVIPHFEVVKRGMVVSPQTQSIDIEKLDIKKHIQTELEIFELVGPALSRTLDAHKPEVISMRKSLARLRSEITRSRATLIDAELQQFIYVFSEPLPLVIPPKLNILAQLPGMNAIRKRIVCEPGTTINEVRREVFQKFAMIDKVNSVGKGPGDFVLKATGYREYLLNNVDLGNNRRLSKQNEGFKMIDYDYIRRCISKKLQIELTLVDSDELYDQVKEVEETSIIDQLLAAEQESAHTTEAEEYPYPTIHNSTPVLITKVTRKFCLKVIGLGDINLNKEEVREKFADKSPSVYVVGELYHGGSSIASPVFTPLSPAQNDLNYATWGNWMEFNIPLRNLPKATRLCMTLYATAETMPPTEISPKDIPLGWNNFQLVDYDGCLRMGVNAMKMWEEGTANPIGTCVENLSAKTPMTLIFELETYTRPLVWPSMTPNDIAPIKQEGGVKKLEPTEARQLQAALAADPLQEIKEEDKKLLWTFRNLCKQKAKALPKFLQAISWNDREQVLEAYRLLQSWAPLSALQALELLDSKFPDENVRKYAIIALESMTDAEVSDYLLQLVQVLKYEAHHDSALSRFLVERALRNRSRIGHSFFWFLRAEMHVPEIEERYGLLLEGYLRSCGRHRTELIKQHTVLQSLYDVAMMVKAAPSPPEKKKVLTEGLSKIKFPNRFQLPLDPRWEVKGLKIEKCKYMDSKKQPLWLVFENVEPNVAPVYVIFKVGDDIRQDILTLQLVRIMDKLWKNAGMDLRLQPYNCVSTGNLIGMVEVVLNANTIANINKDAGGSGAILDDNTLVNWLHENNPTEAEYKEAVDTFILSCAGYVVATYVLGIGDRHADNIMMTKTGNLFRNFKSKFGIKRERAPFIFTPQYLAIVGGKDSENFSRFVETCCKAYNVLRSSSDLFINLFQLMLSTGIPELQSADDIKYLRTALAPDLSDAEAANEMKKQINVALNTKTVIINDLFHGWAH